MHCITSPDELLKLRGWPRSLLTFSSLPRVAIGIVAVNDETEMNAEICVNLEL